MKLYIAEKPSLGRAIAAALPKPYKNHKTHIEVGNCDVVSWCVGHILAQADPQDYDESLKKWSMDDLPIIPEQWQLKPIARTRAQLTVLRKFVKQDDEIVHAGEPDKVTNNSLEIDKSYSSYISTAIGNSIKKISLTPCKFNIISPSLNFNIIKRMLCA